MNTSLLTNYASTLTRVAGAYLLGRLADQGLANFFGQATCRHGTHPLSWLSIHITGFIPSMGGNSTGGSDASIAGYNKGYTYMANGLRRFNANFIQKKFYPRYIPRRYCYTSTNNLLQSINLPFFVSAPAAFFTALILPPIRIRMPQDKLDNMEPAPLMPYTAVRSDEWISPLNLGTVGTIWNVIDYQTPLRMMREPLRVISGIAQLAIAGAVAHYAYNRMPAYILENRTSLIAGAVLGMI